ncbi:DNA adenine methylase [Jeongeupia wiesaeckerbachi]|uniref:DNA adenine methylase n=1 Tax=Jeongeupia wiesaeckerbachi TaxID=3051218 RepID=UPI003D801C81
MHSQPIIPWLGGKRRLADRLLALFPPHDCYVEPFAGGAALFFLRPVPARTEVLNDVNGELVNLYRVVQHHLEEFVRQFKWALTSRQVFEWQQLTDTCTLTDIQRAARFFYLQQHAFGGRVQGQSFGTATTAPPINLCRIEESLSAAHLRLSGVYVEHGSWRDVMSRYDRPHTLFYCDPPYWETEGYGVPWEFNHYTRLAEFMRSCQGRVLVSINDHPAIREAFAGFWMERLDLKYSVGRAQEGAERAVFGELVIANWDAGSSGGLF